MSGRSKGYSVKEDVLLCLFYLEISQDLITGVHQSGDHFWGRVKEAYNNGKDECLEYRNKRSVQSRIQVIERAIRKLNGCVRQVENLRPSGSSEYDILNQAKNLLMQDANYKKGFKFDHVWNMMKDFEKVRGDNARKNKVRKQSSYYVSSESENPTPDSPLVSSPKLSPFSLNLDENVVGDSPLSERSIGVKKVRFKRKIDEGFLSAMKMVQDENNRLVELLMQSSADRQRELEIKKRALSIKEFKEENKILFQNLDAIGDPRVREFIRQEQKRIMDKRSQQFQQPQLQQSFIPCNQYINDVGGSRTDLTKY